MAGILTVSCLRVEIIGGLVYGLVSTGSSCNHRTGHVEAIRSAGGVSAVMSSVNMINQNPAT